MFLLTNRYKAAPRFLFRAGTGCFKSSTLSMNSFFFDFLPCFSLVATIAKEAVSLFGTRSTYQAVAIAANSGVYFAKVYIQCMHNNVVIGKRFHTGA